MPTPGLGPSPYRGELVLGVPHPVGITRLLEVGTKHTNPVRASRLCFPRTGLAPSVQRFTMRHLFGTYLLRITAMEIGPGPDFHRIRVPDVDCRGIPSARVVARVVPNIVAPGPTGW